MQKFTIVLPFIKFLFSSIFSYLFFLNWICSFPEGSEEFELASSADDEVSEKDGKCKGERSDEAGENGDDDDFADNDGDNDDDFADADAVQGTWVTLT